MLEVNSEVNWTFQVFYTLFIVFLRENIYQSTSKVKRKYTLYINNSLHLARKYARIFPAAIICTEKRTLFQEQSCRKTEQTMFKDKYPSIYVWIYEDSVKEIESFLFIYFFYFIFLFAFPVAAAYKSYLA